MRYGHLVQINRWFDNSDQEQALARYPGRLVKSCWWTGSPERWQQLEALVARGNVNGLRLWPIRSPGDDPLAIGEPPPACDCRSQPRQPRRLHLGGVAGVLGAAPEVPVVMEHLGCSIPRTAKPHPGPAAPGDGPGPLRDAHIELHGLGEFALRASPVRVPFPFAEPIPPFLNWAYDALGRGRPMWGSDHSLVSSREGYGLSLRLPMEHFAARSEADRRASSGDRPARLPPAGLTPTPEPGPPGPSDLFS